MLKDIEIGCLDQLEQLKGCSESRVRLVSNFMELQQILGLVHNMTKIVIAYDSEECQVSQIVSEYPNVEFEFLNLLPNMTELIELAGHRNVTSLGVKFNVNNALNELDAVQLGAILPQFKHLRKLALHFSQYNDFGESGLWSISQGLGELTQLHELGIQMGSNNIGPDGAQWLAGCVSKLVDLKILDLFIGQGNQIQSDGAVGIANALIQLQQVTQLSLIIGYQNDIQSTGIMAITKALTLMPNLIELHLIVWCLNNMGEQGGLSAMENISKLKQLQTFEVFLTYSKTMRLMFSLFPHYNDMVNLKSYKVTLWPGNLETPEGAVYFGKSLAGYQLLEELHLTVQSTCIGSAGAKSIGEGIGELKQLKKLTLIIRPNEIGDEGIMGLYNGIRQLTHLNALNIQIDINGVSQMETFNLCESVAFLPVLEQCSIQLKDAQFDAKQLVNEISQTRKRSFEIVSEQMDTKTALFAECVQFDLACTMAMPNK